MLLPTESSWSENGGKIKLTGPVASITSLAQYTIQQLGICTSQTHICDLSLLGGHTYVRFGIRANWNICLNTVKYTSLVTEKSASLENIT